MPSYNTLGRIIGGIKLKEEKPTQEISFRYLLEFRQWLYQNTDKEIVDITSKGDWDQMKIVVKYQSEDEI